MALVLFAFEHASSGDLMVQKSPACTILALALAMKELFHSDSEIREIGIRHGEKMYETLLTKEEMSNAEDMGRYYRVLPDRRDLNYDKYFVEGNKALADVTEYNSNNTERLSIAEIKDTLLTLDYIQAALSAKEIL